MALKHSFKSLKPEPADPTVIGASKWNADHYYVDTAGAPAAPLGSVVFCGTAGLVTHTPSAAGVLTCAAAGAPPLFTTTVDLPADAATIRLGASTDVALVRDAPDTLALRRGSSTQVLRVGPSGGGAELQGASGSVLLTTKAAIPLHFGINGTSQWYINESGHLVCATSTGTIGDGVGNSPVTIYAEDAIYATNKFTSASSLGTTLTNETQVVANNGVILLRTITGLVLIVSASHGVAGLFMFNGTNYAVNEIADPSSVFSNSSGTASQLNVYTGSGQYWFENKRGVSHTIRIIVLGS